jgi:peroxiredoxin
MILMITACTTVVGTGVGDQAPDFKLADLEGNQVSLSSLRGRPVLLNFWATWCPPCRMEIPFIEEIHTEWQDRGLVILAVDAGESTSTVRNFLQAYGYSVTVLLDATQTVTQQYHITGLPTTYFIDSKGIIYDKRIGAFASKDDIISYLNGIVVDN